MRSKRTDKDQTATNILAGQRNTEDTAGGILCINGLTAEPNR